VASLSFDGLTLHYESRGAGQPVVLLHGFTSSAASWERLSWIDLLARSSCEAVALDFRSHGRSDRVYESSACTTSRLASDVLALLDHLELERASLFGFSMGGGVAVRLALDQPGRVAKLVLGGMGDSALNELHDPREIGELVSAFSSPTESTSANAARIRRNAEAAGNDLRALLPFLRQGGWPGGLAHVTPLDVPSLLVIAEADEYMGPTGALVDRLAPTRTLVVEGRGHHDVLADETVKSAVVAFLEA
jgi:pimeloyl-ACP methyl ester carboxylesterase